MAQIRFEAQLFKTGALTILSLPPHASQKLPSRGMTMVEGTINGFGFQAPLEPDGNGSHWLKVGKTMREAIGAAEGDYVTLAIEASKAWPEPEVPADMRTALAADPPTAILWMSLTTMARWDWIRWIGSTKKEATRNKHIDVTLSKLKAGQRRPCCFNRSQCTNPNVSKNGVLSLPVKTSK